VFFLVVAVVCPWAFAQQKAEFTPHLVVSVAGYNQLMSTLQYVGNLVENPQLAGGIEGVIIFATQGRGLQGLDRDRRWGVAVQLDPEKLAEGAEGAEAGSVMVVLPVTNLKMFLDSVTAFVGMPEDQGGGVFKIGQPGQPPGYIKQQGKWAVLSNEKELLALAPADPGSLLAGPGSTYLCSFQVNVGAFPSELVTLALEALENQAREQSARRWDESDEEYAVRMLAQRQGLRLVRNTLRSLETVVLGLDVDVDAGALNLDLAAHVRPGTAAARALNQMRKVTGRFVGLIDADSTMAASWAFDVGRELGGELAQGVDTLRSRAIDQIEKEQRSPAEEELAKNIANSLFDVLQSTVAGGKFEGGMLADFAPQNTVIVYGLTLAEAKKFEDVVRELVAVFRSEAPQVAGLIQLDVATVAGINFHTAKVPIPPDADNREQLVELMGEEMQIALGVGEDVVYLGLGRDALSSVRDVVGTAAGSSAAKPMALAARMNLAGVTALSARFTEDEEERENAQKLAALMESVAEKTDVTFSLTPISNGLQLRLQLEEGVIQAGVKAATELEGGGTGFPGFGGQGRRSPFF